MIKIGIASLLCLLAFEAQADICAFIDQPTAERAYALLQNKHEFVKYCLPCQDEKPQSLAKEDLTLKYVNAEKSLQQIYLNQQPQDLAYLFIYDQKAEKYINLALAADCPNVHNYKDKLVPFLNKELRLNENNKHHDCVGKSYECYQNVAQKSFQKLEEKCRQTIIPTDHDTTMMMQQNAYKVSYCLVDEIKKELRSAFSDAATCDAAEQELDALIKSLHQLYGHLYSENKFCAPRCGTVALLNPPTESRKILQNIYEAIFIVKVQPEF